MIDEKRDIKISVIPFWQGEIFDLKVVKYLKVWKDSHIFLSIDWQAAVQIDCHLVLAFTKDIPICVQNLVAISWTQLFWELHTFSLYWCNFLGKNQVKPGGVTWLPPWKIQNQNQCVFLSFGVDPFHRLSFTEIGEMACSSLAWCSRGHTLKSLWYGFYRRFYRGVFCLSFWETKWSLTLT